MENTILLVELGPYLNSLYLLSSSYFTNLGPLSCGLHLVRSHIEYITHILGL